MSVFGKLQHPAFVFWPVGCGDCTTIVVSDGITLQIDLNDGATAENEDNERIAVVDELVKKLPRRNGRPYLSCFALTHPDLDHIKGFGDLLSQVTIGELWFTPRVFWEYKKELSEHAVAFCEEAQRRVRRTVAAKGDPGAGDRVRVIGYDDLLDKDEYRGLPRDLLTIPGQTITVLDGQDVSSVFSAFVHAPFKDDAAGERNETSLALHIELGNHTAVGRGLFFGDLAYSTIRRIFDETHRHNNGHRLMWDVHLASHHCSKKVMYVQDATGHEVLMKDILVELDRAQGERGGFVIASSAAFPDANAPGDNPPHIKARRRYEEIAANGFICTGEYSTPVNPRPIIFLVTADGLVLADDVPSLAETSQRSLSAAVTTARGATSPPVRQVGFGKPQRP